MKISNQQFRDIISSSRVLSAEQKEFFLEDVEGLPVSYRAEVAMRIMAFDERSKAREAYLSHALRSVCEQFESKLKEEGVDESTRRALLKKAKVIRDSFFLSSV